MSARKKAMFGLVIPVIRRVKTMMLLKLIAPVATRAIPAALLGVVVSMLSVKLCLPDGDSVEIAHR